MCRALAVSVLPHRDDRGLVRRPGSLPRLLPFGSVHTWAGDVGLGTPAVVGPCRSPCLTCSPHRAAEVPLVPGSIEPGALDGDDDFVCPTPMPRRHAPHGMQLISGSTSAFELGFGPHMQCSSPPMATVRHSLRFDCFISSHPRRRSRHRYGPSCDVCLQTPVLRRPCFSCPLWTPHRRMPSASLHPPS